MKKTRSKKSRDTVSLSSRLQRGYNSVEQAEFQHREWQLRSSSVVNSARHMRQTRLAILGEHFNPLPIATVDSLRSGECLASEGHLRNSMVVANDPCREERALWQIGAMEEE
jgi:hypothetical protein